MEDVTKKLVYRKYDAVSVEGPIETKNGKQYYQALFEENADENGGYGSQSRGYVKNFFEDTHSIYFKRCEKYKEMKDNNITITRENNPVKMVAAKDSVEVKPYYLFKADGEKLLNPTTKEQAIGTHLSIFLIPDENAESEIRRRTRTLHFVEIAESIDDTGAGEKQQELVKEKKK
jgi:hypothetical protein